MDVAKGLSLNETEFRDRKLRVTTFKGTVQKKIHELAKSNPKDNTKLKIDADKAMNPALRRKNTKFEKKE